MKEHPTKTEQSAREMTAEEQVRKLAKLFRIKEEHYCAREPKKRTDEDCTYHKCVCVGKFTAAISDALRAKEQRIAELEQSIGYAERDALLAKKSNTERLAAYEKLMQENAELRAQLETLTTGQRIKVCSSDDRTETLREESQYPLRSADKVVPVVKSPKEIGCIYCGLKMDLNEDGATGAMADHIVSCERSPIVQAYTELQVKASERIAELEKALEPFARAYRMAAEPFNISGDSPIASWAPTGWPNARHCRRAEQLLKEKV